MNMPQHGIILALLPRRRQPVTVMHKLEEFEVGQAVLSMGGKRKLYVCRIDPEMRYPILCGTSRDADERDLSGWKPTELQILPEER